MRTAAGTAPPRTRPHRTTLDDVIETGEIVEKRSLVVRSQKVPVIDWNEGPTEIEAPPLAPVPVRNWRVLWLAGAIVMGIAGIVLATRTNPSAKNIPALEARAELLGTTLDGEARAAMVRAEAIATSPVLRAAIETDASTLADMARDRDVAFPLQAGDVLEVYQWRAGERTLMLRLPKDARSIEAPAAGQVRLESANARVVVVATAAIANERSKIAGELVLATPVELRAVAKRIGEAAAGASIVGLPEPVVLVANAGTPNVTIPIPAKTPTAGTLALSAVVLEAGGSGSVFAWICMTLSALLLAGFAVLTVRARNPRTPSAL
ncbi:MAG TPA: hypothetical protein VIV11_30960 [Kofleriaceae bacterium]